MSSKKLTAAAKKKQEKTSFLMVFLKKVQNNKELLFNKFTGSDGAITKEKKAKCWENIQKECENEGIEAFKVGFVNFLATVF